MKKLFALAVVLIIGVFAFTSLAQPAYADRQDRVNAAAKDEPISSTKLNIKYYTEDQIVALGCKATSCYTSDGEPVIEGAIPAVSQTIAFLTTNPPVETGMYVADVMQNFGFAQPAYAQGIGFSALSPVLRIWKAFRNIAYFFIIIFFIIAGFMIMFRQQIDHGTIVTLQMALPKIVTTLILITFSYAIAGFVVDMIYLSIFVFTEILQTFGVLESAVTARNVLFGNSILKVGFKYLMGTGEVAGGSAQAVSNLLTTALNVRWLDWLADSLAYLIIAVAILIAMFRTLFTLISAYIGIIMAVIFAPIQLLFNALPGSNTFDAWFRGLIANAAVFPAVAIMILIGASLVGVSHESNDSMGINIQPGTGWKDGSGWVPPLVAQNDGTGSNVITGIIGLGMIMLLPEIAKIIKESLGVKDQLGELALTNALKGAQQGPVGWIGGGAKWVGHVGTEAATYAGSTLLGQKVRNIGFIRKMEDKATLQQAKHQAHLQHEMYNYAEEEGLKVGQPLSGEGGDHSSGSNGTTRLDR